MDGRLLNLVTSRQALKARGSQRTARSVLVLAR